MRRREVAAVERHEALKAVEGAMCGDCGFTRGGRGHPRVRCPRTGRCGMCGNVWPCREHQP